MPPTIGGIGIDPQGQTVTVSVTPAAKVYLDQAGTTRATFPQTISGRVPYFVSAAEPFTVSVLFNGVEIAGPNGQAVTVQIDQGQMEWIAPTIDQPAENPSVSGTYTQLAPAASGDTTGVTDTTALQALINGVAGGKGTVTLRGNQTYLVTGLTVPDGADLTIYGFGSTIKQVGTALTDLLSNTSPVTKPSVHLFGVTLDGNQQGHGRTTSEWELRICRLSVQRFEARGCVFLNSIHSAINLQDIGDGAWIDGNSFTGMAETDGLGHDHDTHTILANGTVNDGAIFRVTNNHLYVATPSSVGYGANGIQVNWDEANNVGTVDIIIEGNKLTNLGQNLTTDTSPTAAIHMYRDAKHLRIVDNSITNFGYTAIKAQQAELVEIRGNTIDTEQNASLANADEAVITLANRMVGVGTLHNKRVSITNNKIVNTSTRYGIFCNYNDTYEGGQIDVSHNLIETAAGGVWLNEIVGDVTIIGNKFRQLDRGSNGTDYKGIYLQAMTDGKLTVVGNQVSWKSGATAAGQGIFADAGALTTVDAIVVANLFDNCASTVVTLRQLQSLKLTSNKITSFYSGTTAVDVANSTTVTMVDNDAPSTATITTTGVTSLRNVNNSWGQFLAKTTSYALTNADRVAVFNGTSLTATLPDAAAVGAGREYVIKNKNTSAVTVATTSSQTIDGSAPGTVAQWALLHVISDGANWLTV